MFLQTHFSHFRQCAGFILKGPTNERMIFMEIHTEERAAGAGYGSRAVQEQGPEGLLRMIEEEMRDGAVYLQLSRTVPEEQGAVLR